MDKIDEGFIKRYNFLIKVLEGVGNVKEKICTYPPDLHCVAYLVASDLKKSGFDADFDFGLMYGWGAPFSETIENLLGLLAFDDICALVPEASSWMVYPNKPQVFPPTEYRKLERWKAKFSLMKDDALGKRGVKDMIRLAADYAKLDERALYETARQRWYEEHPGSREEAEKSFVSLDKIQSAELVGLFKT